MRVKKSRKTCVEFLKKLFKGPNDCIAAAAADRATARRLTSTKATHADDVQLGVAGANHDAY